MGNQQNIFLNDSRFVAAWHALRSQLLSFLDAESLSAASRSRYGLNASKKWGSSLDFSSLRSLQSLAGIGGLGVTKYVMAALVVAIPVAFGAGMIYQARTTNATVVKTILDHTQAQKDREFQALTQAVAKLREEAQKSLRERSAREAMDAARIEELEGEIQKYDSRNVAIPRALVGYLNRVGGVRTGSEKSERNGKAAVPRP